MHLAYSLITIGNQPRMELCLIPDKPDIFNSPVPVDLLDDSSAAFYSIGVGEGVNISIDPKDNSKIITPLKPGILYITVNTPVNPGVKAHQIKLVYTGDRKYETYYRRDGKEDWRKFISNAPRKEI